MPAMRATDPGSISFKVVQKLSMVAM